MDVLHSKPPKSQPSPRKNPIIACCPSINCRRRGSILPPPPPPQPRPPIAFPSSPMSNKSDGGNMMKEPHIFRFEECWLKWTESGLDSYGMAQYRRERAIRERRPKYVSPKKMELGRQHIFWLQMPRDHEESGDVVVRAAEQNSSNCLFS
ncbi:hypothetical protein EJB05_42817, partial [Eragrostis curvula]